jgi:hypothetical protein
VVETILGLRRDKMPLTHVRGSVESVGYRTLEMRLILSRKRR